MAQGFSWCVASAVMNRYCILFFGLALKSQQSDSFDNRTSVVAQPVTSSVTTFNI